MDVARVAVGLVMKMMRTVKNGEMTVTKGDDGRTNTEDTDGRHGTKPRRPTCNGPWRLYPSYASDELPRLDLGMIRTV